MKAWCYYESRLLGAHHGLLSSYALETMVLYIFNIYHRSVKTPFQVTPAREGVTTEHRCLASVRLRSALLCTRLRTPHERVLPNRHCQQGTCCTT